MSRTSHTPPVPVRYRRVFVTGATALTCAGAAEEGLARCRSGQTALRDEPGIGWCGRIAGVDDLIDLALRVAAPLAPPLRGDELPVLAVAASKGDTGRLLGDGLRPDRLPEAMPGSVLPRLARRLDIPRYVGTAPVAACSTGIYALLEAADAIERGRARTGLAGVVDRSLQPLLLAAFRRMGVLCTGPPAAFTGAGTGFAPAEGAAAVGLNRSGGPWRLIGGLRLGDAGHSTRCLDAGLLDRLLRSLWELAPEPDCIVAHATGTVAGDAYELAGLDRGPWRRVPRLVCKPMIGHCLGASGLVELALALRGPWRRLWKLSFGFGGHVAAVALERSAGV